MRNRSIPWAGAAILWWWLCLPSEALADSPAPYGYPPRGCFREGDSCDAWVNMTYEAGRCVKRTDSAQAGSQVECVALSRLQQPPAGQAGPKPETQPTGVPRKPGKTEPGKRSSSCSLGSTSSHAGWVLLALALAGLGRRVQRSRLTVRHTYQHASARCAR